jgi:hypothetical protein
MTADRSGRRTISPWLAMWSGMRAYGVAIMTIWTLSATTVLIVLAVAVSPAWLKATFGGGAVVELLASALTFWFLNRLNRAGRFDV